jgi:hypothetical protein
VALVTSEVLREALRNLHKRDTLERAVGRAVRNRRGNYEDYLRIMGEVREAARRAKVSPLVAARRLVQEVRP